MLTEQEQHELAEELSHMPQKRACVGEALKIVQRRRGWVDDQALADVAEALEMSPAEVDAVATFYNLIFRRPVGRHVILLCDSISCYVTGYENMKDHLVRKLGIDFGQTTADGRFTLLPVCCLGACDKAPAMMIDQDLHGPIDPRNVDGILEQYK